MIGVDVIGETRRAYFERRRPIKEIVRTPRVSRATVRKVIRGQATEFKYERRFPLPPRRGLTRGGEDSRSGEKRFWPEYTVGRFSAKFSNVV
jgi:hypothetical protein